MTLFMNIIIDVFLNIIIQKPTIGHDKLNRKHDVFFQTMLEVKCNILKEGKTQLRSYNKVVSVFFND